MVAIGDLYGDKFNFSLSIIPTGSGLLDLGPVLPAEVTAVGAAVEEWFNDSTAETGMSITAGAHLTSVKLNRIGADGKYVDDEAREYVLSPYTAGPASIYPAAQLACVVTLLTSVERGRGSKGRFFVPPIGAFNALGTDGRMTDTQALQAANGAKQLIDTINTLYDGFQTGDEKLGRVGVASNVGAGVFREVLNVGVGKVPDTMRSRRESLVEDRIEVAVAAPARRRAAED